MMRPFPSPVARSDTATVTLTASPTMIIVQSESDNEDIVQVVTKMIDAAENGLKRVYMDDRYSEEKYLSSNSSFDSNGSVKKARKVTTSLIKTTPITLRKPVQSKRTSSIAGPPTNTNFAIAQKKKRAVSKGSAEPRIKMEPRVDFAVAVGTAVTVKQSVSRVGSSVDRVDDTFVPPEEVMSDSDSVRNYVRTEDNTLAARWMKDFLQQNARRQEGELDDDSTEDKSDPEETCLDDACKPLSPILPLQTASSVEAHANTPFVRHSVRLPGGLRRVPLTYNQAARNRHNIRVREGEQAYVQQLQEEQQESGWPYTVLHAADSDNISDLQDSPDEAEDSTSEYDPNKTKSVFRKHIE